MRIPVMWRTGAVATTVAALVAVSGCTVQTVVPPAEETPGGQTPAGKPSAGTSSAPGGAPDDAKPSKPKPAAPPTPAPRTLWSKGDRGRDVRELQARLRQVAWLFEGPTGMYDGSTVTAVKGFQGKRGLPRTGKTDTVTWQRLLNMTREPGKWELYASGGQPAATPDPRCLTGRVLCISKTSRTLRWMIDGRTVSTMDVRFGSQYTPTREGVFNVYFKSRHHVSTIYDSPMPYAMFFSGGQAVHYSSDFAATGYSGASHGCVNVRDEGKIAALFSQVRNGDKVVVYW
ncbi:peptidoglycan hydrolase-like protein with peptidoglycan-binding domain [Streptomyces umbrinus]|uniref:L,D-transpeptidase family protein n=1 Tax=Streptomyces umbrinus TaxID=67370 RepID=UPI0019C8F58F|nr:L,D-transpeptidase family protein [Streptomyces umbrinus]MCR3725749.1 peptidoglycan hydrolase-like protein with peptidoglycan-binding domain [Streptomyces umbrinus]GHH49103.1 lipoprotein [Streptomyces umbrinus]